MELEHNWNGRPYHSLDWELKHTFGHKVYKLSLDAGLTLPVLTGTAPWEPEDVFSAVKAVPGILQKTCRPMYGIRSKLPKSM